jgi:hypothetical protein
MGAQPMFNERFKGQIKRSFSSAIAWSNRQLLAVFCLPRRAALGRSLSVMCTNLAGQIQCTWRVRSSANGWASPCNYPERKNETQNERKKVLPEFFPPQHGVHGALNVSARI